MNRSAGGKGKSKKGDRPTQTQATGGKAGGGAAPQSAGARPGSGSAQTDLFGPPLKPRRGLFVVLLLLFVVWVGALVALYMKTVYPLRHSGEGATRPTSAAAPR